MILGLTQRVGTNYLARLLSTHPDCTSPSTLHEDYLASGLGQLDDYIRTVSAHWNEKWGALEKAPALKRGLGRAVADFIDDDSEDAGKRTVLKSPTVSGLAQVAEYLPQCDVLVLTRSGPDAIESGMKSFGWDFDEACRRWGEAAQRVVALMDRKDEHGRRNFMIVKYEDLITAPSDSLRSILDFLNLDSAKFDFSAIEDFPVYGSSVSRGGEAEVHWSPVERPKDFNPLGRAQHWTAGAFRRFDWITRSASASLGYELPYRCRKDLPSRCWQGLLDRRYRLRARLDRHLDYLQYLMGRLGRPR